jgi:hypothetical protein
MKYFQKNIRRKVIQIVNRNYPTNAKSDEAISNAKPFDSIPGPKCYPVIGNLFSLKQYGCFEV